MHRSEGRFLTTHVGSLPRSSRLLSMLQAKEQGARVDEAAFGHQVERDLKAALDHQFEAGIDIAGDGELPRSDFPSMSKTACAALAVWQSAAP